MLPENRKFHFLGELVLNKSRVLDEEAQPKDDEVNWLYLRVSQQQFSFIYKIENALEAQYDKPISAIFAFTMWEVASKIVKLKQPYEVLRGQETIGSISLIYPLE